MEKRDREKAEGMTEPRSTTETFIIRAQKAEIIAQMIRTGEGAAQLCQHEPREVWTVTVQGEGPEEIIAHFSDEQAAVEAAEALDRQMRALVHSDDQGPRLATVGGVTVQ